MPQGLIRLPADSTGKSLRTTYIGADANNDHIQHLLVCDDAGNIVGTLAAQPAGTERGLVVRDAGIVGSGAASTSVATVTTATTLLAANTNRKGATFYNDAAPDLLLRLGSSTSGPASADVSTTSFTVRLRSGEYFELPTTVRFTGEVRGIWAAADSSGACRITELS